MNVKKQCLRCKAFQPISFFGSGSKSCQVCRDYSKAYNQKNKAARAEYARTRLLTAHGKRKNEEGRLRWRYGIDFHDWALIYEYQGHRCAGCQVKLRFEKPTHIDHDHRTGAPRGLLCSACNAVLGLAKDSAATLRRLATYLDDSGTLDFGIQDWEGYDLGPNDVDPTDLVSQ